jgi:transposase-like protein
MCTMPKPYPREFREDVIRVARNREAGVRVKDIAADFGISESCLNNWLAQADRDDGLRSGPTSDDLAENRELRKRGAEQLEQLIIKHDPVLVVFDSYARVVAGPENYADTIRAYYRHTGFVLKRHRVTSVRLDNSGKNPNAGGKWLERERRRRRPLLASDGPRGRPADQTRIPTDQHRARTHPPAQSRNPVPASRTRRRLLAARN